VTTCVYDPLAALGNDFLLFLGATVLVVPVFKVRLAPGAGRRAPTRSLPANRAIPVVLL
jgi:hypothetical protein